MLISGCALLAILGVAAECREKHEPLLESVQLAGCREVLRGPICELEDPTTLVLFVRAQAGARLSVRADDRPQQVTWTPSGNGMIAELRVTTATRSISVEAKRDGTDRWDRSISVWQRPQPLREAETLSKNGNSAQAILDAFEPANVREEIELEKLRGRSAMKSGDGRAAIAHWTRAAELADGAGVVSMATNERLAVAHAAIFNARDLALARRMLEAVRKSPIDQDPLGAAHLAYYEGSLALQTGDFRTAISAFELTERTAARFKNQDTWWMAKHVHSEALTAIGAYDRALEMIVELDRHPNTRASACAEANHLGRLAWADVMARESGERSRIDAQGAIRRALELVTTVCPTPSAIPNHLSVLALALVQEGDHRGARQEVERARTLGVELTPLVQMWLDDILGRVELAEKNFDEAAAAYDRLESLASRAFSPEAAWRAAVGQAAVLRARGKVEPALAEYSRAESMLDEQSLAIAIGGGRGRFIAAKRGASQQQIELLIDAGRTDEAIAAMRRARARGLSGLKKEQRLSAFAGEERARWDDAIARYNNARAELDSSLARDWAVAAAREAEVLALRARLSEEMRLALDDALSLLEPKHVRAELSGSRQVATTQPLVEFSDPIPGELVLGFMPLSKGLLGYAITSSTSRVAFVAENAVLDPFADLLAVTHTVRLLTDGALARLDLHTALIDTHEVVFAVDVPQLEHAGAPKVLAVIVADPRGDLPEARDEAKAIEKVFGPPVELYSGREATREHVVAALERAGTFHYAGHGRFGGDEGFDSALPLAASAELTVGDILAMRSVPARVVLSGCETAQTSTTAGQQLGLAQTFVLAGARAVVAASRPVTDATARRLSELLYERPGEPLPRALRRAQLRLKKDDPTADWAAFRAIAP